MAFTREKRFQREERLCSDAAEVPKPQFSARVGTIFEDSPLGLDKWMSAVWLMANAKKGISSYEIHRALSVTQKSAWFMLERIRLARQRRTFSKPLSGKVEVDEIFLGGNARNITDGIALVRFTAQADRARLRSWVC